MAFLSPKVGFNNARALTEDELFKVAPSVFATAAHESRSLKFSPIPTIDVVRALAKEGFSVVGARQGGTRIAGKELFTKHLLRLRRLADADKYSVGGTVFEILLKNANDGTSAYDLDLGAFRIQCMNGLVAKLGSIDTVKVPHKGDVIPKVIEGTFRVLDGHEAVLEAPANWSQISMSRDDRMAFAAAAHTLRFSDTEGNVTTNVKPEQLLSVHRMADQGHDLWTQFNVVQENAVRGGLSARGSNADGVIRTTTTREIKGIDDNVKLNKALWQLADYFAQNKVQQLAA